MARELLRYDVCVCVCGAMVFATRIPPISASQPPPKRAADIASAMKFAPTMRKKGEWRRRRTAFLAWWRSIALAETLRPLTYFLSAFLWRVVALRGWEYRNGCLCSDPRNVFLCFRNIIQLCFARCVFVCRKIFRSRFSEMSNVDNL